MRECCSGCGETFKEDNIDTCSQCGRTLCWRCMAEHKQTTGHSSQSDQGRFEIQMHHIFHGKFLDSLDFRCEKLPQVKSCESWAAPRSVRVIVELVGETLPYEFLLTREECQAFLDDHDDDKQKLLDYFLDLVAELLAGRIPDTYLRKAPPQQPSFEPKRPNVVVDKEKPKPKPKPKTYRVAASHQELTISALRYWSTISLCSALYLTLLALIVRNILN